MQLVDNLSTTSPQRVVERLPLFFVVGVTPTCYIEVDMAWVS